MQTNLSPLDRALRLAGGLFLVATPILELDTFPYNLLGIIPMATTIAGFCPLYALGHRILLAMGRRLGVPRRTAGAVATGRSRRAVTSWKGFAGQDRSSAT